MKLTTTTGRELKFWHSEFQVACGGTETPITFDNRTYLYVWSPQNGYKYYCFESDVFIGTNEVPWSA